MKYATRSQRKGTDVLAVLALDICFLAAPAWAGQNPVTLAGGGTTVSFPVTMVGSSAVMSATVNVNTSMTVTSISPSGDFTISGDSCSLPATLGAGDSCVLQITFAPSSAGMRWAPLVVSDNNGRKYALGLAGIGTGSVLTFTPGVMSTVAGNGTSGFSGDGGPAASAQFNVPMGVARDSRGNVYIADFVNNVVRKVTPGGAISTVAGDGTQGYSGDGGQATSAQLAYPSSVAVDAASNLYIADYLNSCVRKVDANGVITTVAIGFLVRGVAVDLAGNIYFSSSYEGVWKLDPQGTVTRFAGNGTPGFGGDGGQATEAETSGVAGLAVDKSGVVYIAEVLNSDVRKVDKNGIITTVAGTQQTGYSGDGGPAVNAQFNGPTDVQVDAAGNLYIVDSSNNRIRKVQPDGTIATIAGDGNYGYAGDAGLASTAEFAGPTAITMDSKGNLWIADTGNNVIRELKVDSLVVDFGQVTVGQTGGPVNVVVSNAGNADLSFSSIVASTDFTSETSCSTSDPLTIGSECSISVSFVPDMAGNITGTVTVSNNAAGNPHVISLKGLGYVVPVAAKLVFTNTFPTKQVGANAGTAVVNATDANANLATGFNDTVSLSLQGPAGFTPVGMQGNAANGVVTFNLSSVALNVAGAYTVTASSSGLTSALATFTVTGAADFSVAMSANSLRVATTGSGTLNVTVTPVNGFTGSIALNCSGLPLRSKCSFLPATVSADGSNTPATSVLTISTGVTTTSALDKSGDPIFLATTGTFGAGLVGLVFGPLSVGKRSQGRKRGQVLLMLLVAVILCVGLVACGSLGGQTNSDHSTPAGTYTVTVTGTSSGTSHSTSFTLTVQ